MIGWRGCHVTNGRGKAAESERAGAVCCAFASGPRSRSADSCQGGPCGRACEGLVACLGSGAEAPRRRSGSVPGMSSLSRLQQPAAGARRLSARRATAAPIRQKLLFSGGGSDCEEEEEEEDEEEAEEEEEEGGGGSGNSTGEDSAFQEADSPLSLGRTPARTPPAPPRTPDQGPMELELAPAGLPGDEGDSWEEEGFGSSSPVKSPGAYFMAASPPLAAPRRYCPPPASPPPPPPTPLPDYPGTPPHKTFRKLRLFDTPHTPKVSPAGVAHGARGGCPLSLPQAPPAFPAPEHVGGRPPAGLLFPRRGSLAPPAPSHRAKAECPGREDGGRTKVMALRGRSATPLPLPLSPALSFLKTCLLLGGGRGRAGLFALFVAVERGRERMRSPPAGIQVLVELSRLVWRQEILGRNDNAPRIIVFSTCRWTPGCCQHACKIWDTGLCIKETQCVLILSRGFYAAYTRQFPSVHGTKEWRPFGVILNFQEVSAQLTRASFLLCIVLRNGCC